MVNVTEYLKSRGPYPKGLIQDFLRMERVKYILANGESMETKAGRYSGYTLFSDGLFAMFLAWLKKEPIPLLNRKEYEVDAFIRAFFGEDVRPQYRVGRFVYDWFIPSQNILIEFHEKEHQTKKIKGKDAPKECPNLFVIHERTVMRDLAQLARRAITPQPPL